MNIFKIIFKNELATYRFFGFFAGIMLPVFGYLHMVKEGPSDADPFWLRLVVGGLCIVLTGSTFFLPVFKKNLNLIIMIMSYVMITWFTFVLYGKDFKPTYIFGAFILVTAPSFTFKKAKTLLPFIAYAVLIITTAAFMSEEPMMPPAILSVTMATFFFIIFIFRNSAIKLQAKVYAKNDELLSKNAILNEKNEEIQQQTEEIQAQKDLLEAINEEINHKNKSITDSIEYARNIQFAMLPSKESIDEIFNNYFIIFKPRDIVSGDFYWSYDLGDKVLWAAGDCTGHGVPGAFMSLISMSLLNEIVIENRLDNPSEVLNKLRDQIIGRLDAHNYSNRKDGLDIGLCVFDKKSKVLTFAGAYNPALILRDNEIIEIKGDKMPVGKHRLMDPFVNQEFQLQTDDVVYTFSDGYTDQLGGEKRKKYSKSRMVKLMATLGDMSMEDQERFLSEEFDKWKGNFEQLDDVVLFGVKID